MRRQSVHRREQGFREKLDLLKQSIAHSLKKSRDSLHTSGSKTRRNPPTREPEDRSSTKRKPRPFPAHDSIHKVDDLGPPLRLSTLTAMPPKHWPLSPGLVGKQNQPSAKRQTPDSRGKLIQAQLRLTQLSEQLTVYTAKVTALEKQLDAARKAKDDSERASKERIDALTAQFNAALQSLQQSRDEAYAFGGELAARLGSLPRAPPVQPQVKLYDTVFRGCQSSSTQTQLCLLEQFVSAQLLRVSQLKLTYEQRLAALQRQCQADLYYSLQSIKDCSTIKQDVKPPDPDLYLNLLRAQDPHRPSSLTANIATTTDSLGAGRPLAQFALQVTPQVGYAGSQTDKPRQISQSTQSIPCRSQACQCEPLRVSQQGQQIQRLQGSKVGSQTDPIIVMCSGTQWGTITSASTSVPIKRLANSSQLSVCLNLTALKHTKLALSRQVGINVKWDYPVKRQSPTQVQFSTYQVCCQTELAQDNKNVETQVLNSIYSQTFFQAIPVFTQTVVASVQRQAQSQLSGDCLLLKHHIQSADQVSQTAVLQLNQQQTMTLTCSADAVCSTDVVALVENGCTATCSVSQNWQQSQSTVLAQTQQQCTVQTKQASLNCVPLSFSVQLQCGAGLNREEQGQQCQCFEEPKKALADISQQYVAAELCESAQQSQILVAVQAGLQVGVEQDETGQQYELLLVDGSQQCQRTTTCNRGDQSETETRDAAQQCQPSTQETSQQVVIRTKQTGQDMQVTRSLSISQQCYPRPSISVEQQCLSVFVVQKGQQVQSRAESTQREQQCQHAMGVQSMQQVQFRQLVQAATTGQQMDLILYTQSAQQTGQQMQTLVFCQTGQQVTPDPVADQGQQTEPIRLVETGQQFEKTLFKQVFQQSQKADYCQTGQQLDSRVVVQVGQQSQTTQLIQHDQVMPQVKVQFLQQGTQCIFEAANQGLQICPQTIEQQCQCFTPQFQGIDTQTHLKSKNISSQIAQSVRPCSVSISYVQAHCQHSISQREFSQQTDTLEQDGSQQTDIRALTQTCAYEICCQPLAATKSFNNQVLYHYSQQKAKALIQDISTQTAERPVEIVVSQQENAFNSSFQQRQVISRVQVQDIEAQISSVSIWEDAGVQTEAIGDQRTALKRLLERALQDQSWEEGDSLAQALQSELMRVRLGSRQVARSQILSQIEQHKNNQTYLSDISLFKIREPTNKSRGTMTELKGFESEEVSEMICQLVREEHYAKVKAACLQQKSAQVDQQMKNLRKELALSEAQNRQFRKMVEINGTGVKAILVSFLDLVADGKRSEAKEVLKMLLKIIEPSAQLTKKVEAKLFRESRLWPF